MNMAVSYKKLWKLLIDKDMKKKDLCIKAGISPASVSKMGKNGHVTTEILLKICTALNCQVEDIMEIIHFQQNFMIILILRLRYLMPQRGWYMGSSLQHWN